MYLDATTRSLEILLGDTVTTNQLPCVAGWTDTTTTDVTPGTTRSISNNTTAVTAVAAPGASTQRQIQTLNVFNADTVDATVTVRLNDNSTYANLVSVTLAAGESLVYEARRGWQVIQADGSLKNGNQGETGATGATGATGPQGDAGPQGDPGEGVPTGGTTGQVLVKASNDDYDTEWATNPDAVTLAGTLDYLTLSGQEITRNAIDLTTDVTGTLPVANGGTGVTSLASLDAADLGSGAGINGYALTADGAGGAAWELLYHPAITGHAVLGTPLNTPDVPEPIECNNDGHVLRRSGADLGFGLLDQTSISDNAITYAKMQNVSAASRLLGRGSAAGSGDPEEIVLGTGLSMSGTTLSASSTLDITGLTAADAALTDVVPHYNASASANRKATISHLLALLAPTPRGRLTLTTATPVTTSDVTTSSNLYYTPLDGNTIVLWDGTRWVCLTFTEITLALSGLTSGKNYDVFAYISSGSVAIESLVWTDDTTRATAVTYQNGRLCKSGDKTRLYLGTFRTVSTTETCDTEAKRYLYNHYNRRGRKLRCYDTTDSWNYNGTTFREARAQSTEGTSRVGVVSGWADCEIGLENVMRPQASQYILGCGIGRDSDTNIADHYGGTAYGAVPARYRGCVPVGYHYFSRLEATPLNHTIYGDNALAYLLSGMVGTVMM